MIVYTKSTKMYIQKSADKNPVPPMGDIGSV